MDDNKHDINVKHVADLAAINLSNDEMERFQSQLAQVLSYINQLNEVDISNVDDFQNKATTLDELREDSIKNSIRVSISHLTSLSEINQFCNDLFEAYNRLLPH